MESFVNISSSAAARVQQQMMNDLYNKNQQNKQEEDCEIEDSFVIVDDPSQVNNPKVVNKSQQQQNNLHQMNNLQESKRAFEDSKDQIQNQHYYQNIQDSSLDKHQIEQDFQAYSVYFGNQNQQDKQDDQSMSEQNPQSNNFQEINNKVVNDQNQNNFHQPENFAFAFICIQCDKKEYLSHERVEYIKKLGFAMPKRCDTCLSKYQRWIKYLERKGLLEDAEVDDIDDFDEIEEEERKFNYSKRHFKKMLKDQKRLADGHGQQFRDQEFVDPQEINPQDQQKKHYTVKNNQAKDLEPQEIAFMIECKVCRLSEPMTRDKAKFFEQESAASLPDICKKCYIKEQYMKEVNQVERWRSNMGVRYVQHVDDEERQQNLERLKEVRRKREMFMKEHLEDRENRFNEQQPQQQK
eukprot:403358042